jgi:hypothetical protein
LNFTPDFDLRNSRHIIAELSLPRCRDVLKLFSESSEKAERTKDVRGSLGRFDRPLISDWDRGGVSKWETSRFTGGLLLQ